MIDFSIELAAEQIYDNRSRDHFEEVRIAYASGCYRSAMVTLWSVIICDLLYKLQDLRDVHNDESASKVLQEMEQQQQRNPESPDWESKLLSAAQERTGLLGKAELVALQNLQKERHIAAHPILGQADLLHKPTREKVRAYIRDALEAVLVKPPMVSKKIVNVLVEDLAQKKDLLPDRATLRKYLEAKYFKNVPPLVEDEIFKALWKFVFQIHNENTDAHRNINTGALKLLFERRPQRCIEILKQDGDRLGSIQQDLMGNLVNFLAKQPSAFSALSQTTRIPLDTLLDKDFDLYARAHFKSESLEQHLDGIRKRIAGSTGKRLSLSTETWTWLVNLTDEQGGKENLLWCGIDMYGASAAYDEADTRFTRYIEPHLREMSKDQLNGLIQLIETNGQTTGRRKAGKEHRLVYEAFTKAVGEEVDLAVTCPNFYASCGVKRRAEVVEK